MKSLAKRILTEMALDLGDAPDWIDPEKKRKIQQGTHPYAQNPAFPTEKPPRRPGPPYKDDPNRPDPTRSYSELVASHVYPEIVKKVERYTGHDPRRTPPQMLMALMMQAMRRAVQAESRHRPELEQAAVEVVLSLPEFSGAREAVEAGDLRIEAHLRDPMAMMQQMQQRIQGAEQTTEIGHAEGEDEAGEADGGEAEAGEDLPLMQVEPGEESEEEREELGLHVPQIRGEYDAEAQKRRFVNLLIQGAAINKNYAYHEIADQLRAIDPNLLNTYGQLMSIGELMYWVSPEQMLNQMMGSGSGGGGMEEVTPEEDGTYTIRATALCFPVLIQELTKGLYEFLSHNEDDPDDVRKYAYAKGDTLGNEQWDIMQGPGVWRHFNHLITQANAADLTGRIYRHLVTLPTGEFNTLMPEILRETPRGRQYIQQLVREIRAEDSNRQQESKAFRIIRGV